MSYKIEAIMRQNHTDLTRHWAHDIYEVFQAQGISMVSYVPDAGHVDLIKLCEADERMRVLSLTTEEEGVAFAAGAYLGGKRAALLMQSSGVGNCINMLSLIKTCQLPFLTLVTMRGEYGEFNPWQIPMGQATPAVLSAMGLFVYRVDFSNDVREVLEAAVGMAFGGYCGVAVLLSQRLIGIKRFVEEK
jgi:sulfopyruvate decarboxylase alpha subunit